MYTYVYVYICIYTFRLTYIRKQMVYGRKDGTEDAALSPAGLVPEFTGL